MKKEADQCTNAAATTSAWNHLIFIPEVRQAFFNECGHKSFLLCKSTLRVFGSSKFAIKMKRARGVDDLKTRILAMTTRLPNNPLHIRMHCEAASWGAPAESLSDMSFLPPGIKLSKLTLDLNHCMVDITKFAQCQKLVLGNLRLYAECGGLLDLAKALGSNSACPVVEDIDLTYIPLSNADCEVLGQELAKAKCVKRVYLKCNGVYSYSIDYLSTMIGAGSQIESFSCVQNGMNNEGVRNISKHISQNTHLLSLRLDKGSIANAGACSLAEALTSNTQLTTLSLWQNNIGDVGVIALSALLLNMRGKLQLLDLSDNSFSDDGAEAIGNALCGNSRLQLLYLFGNQIQSKGAQAIAKPLIEKNALLQQLFLNDNNIGDEGAWSLGLAMKANPKLQRIDLRKNDIGIGAAKEIILELSRRSNEGSVKPGMRGIPSAREQKAASQLISF
jgi:Ran GTPase-activating protein (RanGAP) involved in mRNA processing and transport